MKEKTVYIDLLRIVACFFVIVIHTASQYWYDTSPLDFEWKVLNFYDCFSRCAVPIFFMISGALFLNKKEISIKSLFKKNILHLINSYIFWVLFYIIVDAPTLHFWFVPVMIGVYFLIPILYSFIQHKNCLHIRYSLVIFVVFVILKNTLMAVPYLPEAVYDLLSSSSHKVFEYSGYFILGYWLSNLKTKCKKSTLLFVFVFNVICATVLSAMISNAFGKPMDNLYGYFGIFTFLEACCLFLFFKDIDISSDRAKTLINKVSGCTYGIYLLHIFVLNYLKNTFGLDVIISHPILSVPLLSLCVFVVSLLIILFLKKIPLFNKWCV